MNRLFTLFLTVAAILFVFSGCVYELKPNSHAEPITTYEPIETLPLTTEPPATTIPTEPEPTEPPLGIDPGAHFDTYYSEEYDDYLDYYIHIPENADTGMPLILSLHGAGEVNLPHEIPECGISCFAYEIYGDDFPFILLEPNTRVRSWTSGNIPKLMKELTDHIADRFSVNTDKIIITGYSLGAMGVWDMISVYGNYFSAAVPVSSPHQKGHIHYLKAAEVPVWTFAGDIGDTERWYHQYLEKNVEMINVSDGYGKFTVLEGCDHGKARIEAYVEETFEWMLSQQRGVIPEE